MKKERLNYFEKFTDGANYSIKCVNMLLEILTNFKKEEIGSSIEEMHKIENDADMSKHEMMNFLLKDFLPPIEREDIINLAHRIDNVTDFTEEVLIDIDIFNVEKIPEDAIKCAELLAKCCENVKVLLDEFEDYKKSKDIMNKIVEINELEEEGDKLYTNCMKKLYKNEKEAVFIMIWTTIFNRFEDCFDACESVADYVESIIMKNS